MKTYSVILLTSAVCALSACAPGMAINTRSVESNIARNGEYWQRTDATSAMWMQGPKAQQVLNRDMSRCVTELAELERLGQIKAAFPADRTDTDMAEDAAHKDLMNWDSPDRDGMLLTEPTQYNDFETCMKSKGWERTMYVPPAVAQRGAEAYVQNHVVLKNRTMYDPNGTDSSMDTAASYND